eukprot:RCo000410
MGERRMYSATQRANSVATIAVSNLAILTGLLALSSLYYENFGHQDPQASARVSTILRYGQIIDFRRQSLEELRITLNLDADFRTLFHWNVKQLFVFVSANFKSPQGSFGVVLWDAIITSPEKAVLHLEGIPTKYPLIAKVGALRGANVTLTFHWSCMPHAGRIAMASTESSFLVVPSEYIDGRRS